MVLTTFHAAPHPSSPPTLKHAVRVRKNQGICMSGANRKQTGDSAGEGSTS